LAAARSCAQCAATSIADFVCCGVPVFGSLTIAAEEKAIPDGFQAQRLIRRMPVLCLGRLMVG